MREDLGRVMRFLPAGRRRGDDGLDWSGGLIGWEEEEARCGLRPEREGDGGLGWSGRSRMIRLALAGRRRKKGKEEVDDVARLARSKG